MAPLAAQTLVSCLQQLLFDLVGDRRDIAFAATGREQKDIDERERLRDIQRHEVLGTRRLSRGSRDREHLLRRFSSRHARAPVLA